MLPSRLAAGTAIWGALASLAGATDQPISGVSLRIESNASGKQRLVFSSKDPAFLFPSADDDAPTQAGLTVEVFSTTERAGATATAPATGVTPGWKVGTGAQGWYRFRRDRALTAATPVRRAVLRQGRSLKVVLDDVGLAMTAQQVAVGIRITTGTLRSCARFAGSSVVTDRAGLFVGHAAPADALADCATSTLLGLAPTCGDGEINGTEVCDGADTGPCELFFFSCVPAGVAGECTGCCIGEGELDPFGVGCCNPSSIRAPAPPINVQCIATRCDPPFDCGDNTCQPDGSCCTPKDAVCVMFLDELTIPLNPCCGDLVCGAMNGNVATCCMPAAGACTDDGDCCSGQCAAGACV